MKLTPSPLPHGQGIYALIHRASQSIYIGSSVGLRGRASEWKSALKHRNHRLQNTGFPDHPVDEWEFRVLRLTDGVSYEELRRIETQAIERAKAQGMVLLNKTMPANHYRFTIDGIEGSAYFHANRLGKNPTNVAQKLRKGYTIEQALGREERPTKPFDARASGLMQMPVPVVDDLGRLITYSEAAEATGRSVERIKDRCKAIRVSMPGTLQIKLDQLKLR